MVSLLTTGLTPPSSALYSNNIQIAINLCDTTESNCKLVGYCTDIIDSSTNPESDCGGLVGNRVSILGAPNSQLGINSLGILANCDCTKTSFLSKDIAQWVDYESYYISLISSGENYFTVYLNLDKLDIPLNDISTITDSVSLMCGDVYALNFCPNRELVIWDNDLN